MSQSKPVLLRIIQVAAVVAVSLLASALFALIGRLDRLIALSESTAKKAEPAVIGADWVNLKLRLVQDRPDGPPAEGFTVEVPELLVSPGVPSTQVSDSSGVVDLGVVRPGRRELRVTSRWNSTCHVEFDVRAGNASQSEVLVCPSAPPPDGVVAIYVEWPDHFDLSMVGLVCRVNPEPLKLHGGSWFDLDPGPSDAVFVRGDGMIFKCENVYGGRKVTKLNGDLHCRGQSLQCCVSSVAILPTATAGKKVALLEEFGWGLRLEPAGLHQDPKGANQFKIVVSREMLAEMYPHLAERASVDRTLE